MSNYLLKIQLTLLFFLFSALTFCSYNQKNRYDVSLLTYSPGTELYSVFGHSAIRVIDSLSNSDLTYNYGTFDFNTPKFYQKFIKGKLFYRLSRTSTEYAINQAIHENRTITENKLLLSPRELNNLIDQLNFNYLPENRNYLYDFFYDNCATRILKLVDSASSNNYMLAQPNYSPNTFLKLTTSFLEEQKWAELGIIVAMGKESLTKATISETAFLPDYLQSIFLNKTNNQSNLPLVGKSEVLLSKNNSSIDKGIHHNPTIVFLILLILIATLKFIEVQKGRRLKFLNILIYTPPIITSIILVGLWVFSDHYIYKWNPTLLWASPLWVFMFFKSFRERTEFRITVLILILTALAIKLFFIQSIAILMYIITLGIGLIPIKSAK